MFTILSRRDSGSDKCPRCSRLNVDFIDLGLGMLGCFDCGTVFVTKVERAKVRVTPKVKVVAINIPVTPLEIVLPGEVVSDPFLDEPLAEIMPYGMDLLKGVKDGSVTATEAVLSVKEKKPIIKRKKKKPRRMFPEKES